MQWAAGTALTIASVLLLAAPAAASTSTDETTPDQAVVSATLDGAPASDYDAGDPLVLRPDRELVVAVEVTNRGDTELVVRSVRIESRVLGVVFIDYDTRVDVVVPPGETVDRSYDLYLGPLNEQAVGLLPLELRVLDDERGTVGSPVQLVADAQGGLTSNYGLFGLYVAVATAILLVSALVRLARGTLPEHRWFRAVRFAAPGVGIGLTIAATLSVMRLMVPSPGSAGTIVVVCGLAGLVLGFLTPAPDYRGPRARRSRGADHRADPQRHDDVAAPVPAGQPIADPGPVVAPAEDRPTVGAQPAPAELGRSRVEP